MPLTIHVPKPDTSRRRLQSYEHGGAPSGRIPGGWVADLIGLKRSLMFCPFCVNKFHPKQHAYELWRREWLAVASCDGCKHTSPYCKVFIHQSFHDDLGEDRRRGRWVT